MLRQTALSVLDETGDGDGVQIEDTVCSTIRLFKFVHTDVIAHEIEAISTLGASLKDELFVHVVCTKIVLEMW